MQKTFREWLLNERREFVPQEVINRYEEGFRQALRKLLQRIQDPLLRAKVQGMLDCPIRDANGHCRSFTDYIIAALTKHQIHRRGDIEEALAYVYENMMMDKKLTGDPKATIFGSFNADRPYSPQGNPLESRYKSAVANAVTNIARRISSSAGRPQGSMSISSGRSRGEMAGVSADEIPNRPDPNQGLAELVSDIASLLARKETEYRLPLNAMFGAMLAGQRTPDKRQHFGGSAIKKAQPIIVKTIEQYAKDSGNTYLTALLSRIKNPSETPKAKPAKTAPEFSSLKHKDFASILSAVERLGGRPAGTADLGRLRRRWLEYAPRDAATGHRNRLDDVLAQMLRDGVLSTIHTARGATAYVPGPNADEYRRAAAA